ncbi:MAG TPA: hypothetical protein VGP97_18320, partial [Burkholderiales bacterium]|nr:hypothetical protein [Burkholderiales bacterium]
MVEVDAAAVEHALEILGARGVVGRLLAYQVAVEVGHGEALAHALPEIVGLRGAIDLAHAAQRLGNLLALALKRRQLRRVEHAAAGGWLRWRGRSELRRSGLGGGGLRLDGGCRRGNAVLRLRFRRCGRRAGASLHQDGCGYREET